MKTFQKVDLAGIALVALAVLGAVAAGTITGIAVAGTTTVVGQSNPAVDVAAVQNAV